MTYHPKINDYVIWNKGVEGWVYFQDEQYITIEVCVRPKNEQNYQACSIHRNERLLVICYKNQWEQLTYIKSRESIHEETKKYVETLGESTWGEGNEK